MKLCKDCRWYKRNFALGDLCAAPQNLVTPKPNLVSGAPWAPYYRHEYRLAQRNSG